MYRQQMLNAYSTNSEGLGSRKNNVVLKENEERGFKKQACKMAFFILSFEQFYIIGSLKQGKPR